MEAAAGDSPSDRVLREPTLPELIGVHHAPLPRRHLRDENVGPKGELFALCANN
jgi:hypothetical protein